MQSPTTSKYLVISRIGQDLSTATTDIVGIDGNVVARELSTSYTSLSIVGDHIVTYDIPTGITRSGRITDSVELMYTRQQQQNAYASGYYNIIAHDSGYVDLFTESTYSYTTHNQKLVGRLLPGYAVTYGKGDVDDRCQIHIHDHLSDTLLSPQFTSCTNWILESSTESLMALKDMRGFIFMYRYNVHKSAHDTCVMVGLPDSTVELSTITCTAHLHVRKRITHFQWEINGTRLPTTRKPTLSYTFTKRGLNTVTLYAIDSLSGDEISFSKQISVRPAAGRLIYNAQPDTNGKILPIIHLSHITPNDLIVTTNTETTTIRIAGDTTSRTWYHTPTLHQSGIHYPLFMVNNVDAGILMTPYQKSSDSTGRNPWTYACTRVSFKSGTTMHQTHILGENPFDSTTSYSPRHLVIHGANKQWLVVTGVVSTDGKRHYQEANWIYNGRDRNLLHITPWIESTGELSPVVNVDAGFGEYGLLIRRNAIDIYHSLESRLHNRIKPTDGTTFNHALMIDSTTVLTTAGVYNLTDVWKLDHELPDGIHYLARIPNLPYVLALNKNPASSMGYIIDQRTAAIHSILAAGYSSPTFAVYSSSLNGMLVCDSLGHVVLVPTIVLGLYDEQVASGANTITITPNPAGDIVSTNSPGHYTLVNSIGEQIDTGNSSDGTINVSSVPSGIYLLTIHTDSELCHSVLKVRH